MNVNYENGCLSTTDKTITPQLTIIDFKKLFQKNQIELWGDNGEWESYKLQFSIEYIYIFHFYKKCIKKVEIYATLKNKQGLNEVLKKIKPNKYKWGIIELNNDVKASYKSIIITYNIHSER